MYIDAHTHLDKYGQELDSALAEIDRLQILTISVAMDPESYGRSRDIASRSKNIIPCFGIHPWNAQSYADKLQDLDPLIQQSPMIGEIGLDFHWVEDNSTYPAQLRVCDYFLSAAREHGKIVNLHTKGAESEILGLLEKNGIERAIVHWYSGPLDTLREMIAHRCYFTIGVEIRFSEVIQEVAREIPLDLLLTETDNPGGEEWLAGRIGMPGLISDVVDKLAELRGMARDQLINTVQSNFSRLTEGLDLPLV